MASNKYLYRYYKVPSAIAILLVLAGCPAIINGQLKNETSESVLIGAPSSSWWVLTEPGKTSTSSVIPWTCIAIATKSGYRFFRFDPASEIPEDAIEAKFSSSDLSLIYTQEGLFLDSPSQGNVAFDELSDCEHPKE